MTASPLEQGEGQQRAAAPLADWVITAVLLAMFVGGLAMAMDFAFRAALVPRLVCGGGILFCTLNLGRLALSRRAPAPASGGLAAAGSAQPAHDDGDDAFATATRKAWLEALGWFIGFFVVLALFGTLVTVPVFAAAYLTVVGRVRVIWAVVYGAVAWAFLYVAFDRILHLTLPTGWLL